MSRLTLPPGTNIRDIPQVTRTPTNGVDVSWDYLEKWIADRADEYGDNFELDPDFQRGHVWSVDQQIAYVESSLRGAQVPRDILWNDPEWRHSKGQTPRLVLVDGKQRLEAVRKFMRGELPAFGLRVDQFTGCIRVQLSLYFRVNELPTRADVLRWYIELNSGGVAHTPREINRVRRLLQQETDKDNHVPI